MNEVGRLSNFAFCFGYGSHPRILRLCRRTCCGQPARGYGALSVGVSHLRARASARHYVQRSSACL